MDRELLKADLDAERVGHVLLDRLRLIDEGSRSTAAYLDPRYAPFYYHLGKRISPRKVLEIGFDIGILSTCFLTSCKSVEKFFGFTDIGEEFISTRLGKSNVRLQFKKEAIYAECGLYDEPFQQEFWKEKWDLVLITAKAGYDRYREYLETAWSGLSEEGIMVAEWTRDEKEAFDSFAAGKNRIPAFFETRYGTGMVFR